MDSSSYGWKIGSPCSHHHHHHNHRFFLCPNHPHHHHRLVPHCPLHCSLLHSNTRSQICHRFNPPLYQYSEPVASSSSPTNLNLQASDYNQSYTSDTQVMQEGNEGLEEEEDEEDFVFVLTDEWKEFFAKSEAKRRLVKKQAKKKGKD